MLVSTLYRVSTHPSLRVRMGVHKHMVLYDHTKSGLKYKLSNNNQALRNNAGVILKVTPLHENNEHVGTM